MIHKKNADLDPKACESLILDPSPLSPDPTFSITNPTLLIPDPTYFVVFVMTLTFATVIGNIWVSSEYFGTPPLTDTPQYSPWIPRVA